MRRIPLILAAALAVTALFADATGSGTLYGALTPNGDSVHFRGTITLP